jgi:predicted acyltransferase
MTTIAPLDENLIAPPVAPRTRWMSVDALRGFDMFWILGAGGLVKGLKEFAHSPTADFLAQQLSHKPWEGFAFYDLIFPLFNFLIGVSIVFSLTRILERSGPRAAHSRIVRRFVLLFLLGIFYSGGFAYEWPNIRLLGVLQRLALCYFFAALIFCHFDLKGMVLICIGLLLGYWAIMALVPVPDIGKGCFEPGRNLSNYIDRICLPGRKYDGTWDPEGILSTLPAISTCLIGVFAGMLLRRQTVADRYKVLLLILAGTAMAALGYQWGAWFPVIKKIWTSSYVLVAGGYSCVLLGVFYLVVDVWGLQAWARPFVWVGMNPLTLYMGNNIIHFDEVAQRLVGGDIKNALGQYGEAVIGIVSLMIALALARFLYRRNIFLRL